MPIRTYFNWNKRSAEEEVQIEPYRKYFFICEGANTEVFYFKQPIDLKKQLNIHPMIDIRLWEKTDRDKDITYPRKLFEFAKEQKLALADEFDAERDKMIVVFDGDIFEEKVHGYEQLIADIQEKDIAAITNPNFELFLLLHIPNSYENYIKGKEQDCLTKDNYGRYSYASKILLETIGMNAKKNKRIGELANNVLTAIEQEKYINQDVSNIKGKVSSNIGAIIEEIINEKPDALRNAN